MKTGNAKQRLMLGLALVAVAAGLVIAFSGGGKGHHHKHSRARGVLAPGAGSGAGPGSGASNGGSRAGDSSSGSSGGSEDNPSPVPTRNVLAANYLGLTTQQLRNRLHTGKSLGQLADATRGKSARGLIEAIVNAKAARIRALKLPAATQKTRIEHYRLLIQRQVERVRGSIAVERDLVSASAYLGMSNAQLHLLVQGGQTLAQVAQSTKGRSTDGLIETIAKARKSRLEAVARQGVLSAAQLKAGLAQVRATVAAEVNHKLLQPKGK